MHVISTECIHDPAQLSDDQLLLEATLHEQLWAVNALMVRFFAWVCALVAHLGKRQGLQDADIENAQQEAMLGVRKAILKFDCLLLKKQANFSLRTLMRVVVQRRVRDFVRDLHRSLLYRAASLDAWTNEARGTLGSVSLRLPAYLIDGRAVDPAELAEQTERIAKVHVILEAMNATERCICEAVAAGTPVSQMLESLRLSDRTIRRKRKQAFSRMSVLLDGASAASCN